MATVVKKQFTKGSIVLDEGAGENETKTFIVEVTADEPLMLLEDAIASVTGSYSDYKGATVKVYTAV